MRLGVPILFLTMNNFQTILSHFYDANRTFTMCDMLMHDIPFDYDNQTTCAYTQVIFINSK